ncbi:ATP synthase F1 subunit delta [Candidatus Gottesmanbacteria bacterium]|nr:ATP synthase F1 subunit delta [Candidatus Gottesmanbacteria bacterium]
MKSITKKSKQVVAAVVDYLKDSGQEKLLGEVTKNFKKEEQKAKGADRAIITSPIKLTSDQIASVNKFIKTTLNVSVPLEVHVDKNLIGGFTLRVGDWYLDASIASELQLLKRQLLSY